MSADVNRRTEPERPDARDRSGDRETSRIDRLLSASRSPLVAWALLILAVIYFGGMKLELLEKENVELQHHPPDMLIRLVPHLDAKGEIAGNVVQVGIGQLPQ